MKFQPVVWWRGKVATGAAATNLITVPTTMGLVDGDRVMINDGTGGAGLPMATELRAINTGATTFRLSLDGVTPIDITADYSALSIWRSIRLSLAQNPWAPASRGVGGSNVSGAGVPNAYELRRDELCRIEPRFYESEWAQVCTWLRYQQANPADAFYYFFDGLTLPHYCYLESPKQGENIEPVRDALYPKVFALGMVIRLVGGAAPFNVALRP